MSGHLYRNFGKLALCCECGHARKVDGRSCGFHRTYELDDNPDHWRMTALIKCHGACGTHTTHALLRREDDPTRDEAEWVSR